MMQERPINPTMITLARESRGWTQGELAEALATSQSRVSRLEMGAEPTSEELAALCRVLDYDAEFFRQCEPLHAVGASLLYRQRSRVPVKVQRRIEAEINVRKMQVSRLLKSAAPDDHLFPSLPRDTFDGNVEEIAREVRRIWKTPDGPVRDLTKLIESAGGIVVQMDFGTRLIDGAHLWVPGLPPLFFMSNTVAGERYRFSLAHELGHAIMHRATAGGEIEDEAQEFASEFLMPRAQIRTDLRNFNLEVARRLKAFWKVSMQALIERAHRLGVITDQKRRRLYTQISAQGGRINEPWPLELEQASRLDEISTFHRETLGFTEEQMRAVMFTSRFGSLETKAAGPSLRLAGEGEFASLNPADPTAPSPPSWRLPPASLG